METGGEELGREGSRPVEAERLEEEKQDKQEIDSDSYHLMEVAS